MADDLILTEMQSFFLAFADKTRLRLLNLMRGGEICVCFLVEILDESQPKISRHLAYLRNAGVVEARRDGKWMHYKISEPANDYAAHFLQNTLAWLISQENLNDEYERLTKMCFLLNNNSTISNSPKIDIFAHPHIINKKSQELETFLL